MSTLTPEQHAEQAWVEWNADDGPSCSLVEHIFLAGMRYQHERTREAAAKVCEAADERAYPWACAAMIRALTLDEC